MHILLATLGSAGDVNPLIVLGRALVQRGRQVSVAANAHFSERIEQAGLEFIQLGSEELYQAINRDPDLWLPAKAFDVIARHNILPLMRPLYEIIAQFDPHRTILAAAGLCLGARMAQERLGFRLATLHLQPVMLQSAYRSPRFGGLSMPDWLPPFVKRWVFWSIDALVSDRLLGPEVNAFRAELGLQPVRRIFSHWLHSPDKVIGLFPDWFAPPQPDWPANMQLTGFPGEVSTPSDALPSGLEAFLVAGEAPVVFTPGTAMQHGRRLFAESLQACERLGCRGVFVTPYQDQLPHALPAQILAVNFAPFAALLPRAAALVYHGGIGTLAQAMAAGLPQLVVPMSHDQPDNAVRLQRLGVGDWLSPRAYRDTSVARRLERLLSSPQVRANCERFRAKVNFVLAQERACLAIESFGVIQ